MQSREVSSAKIRNLELFFVSQKTLIQLVKIMKQKQKQKTPTCKVYGGIHRIVKHPFTRIYYILIGTHVGFWFMTHSITPLSTSSMSVELKLYSRQILSIRQMCPLSLCSQAGIIVMFPKGMATNSNSCCWKRHWRLDLCVSYLLITVTK